MLYEMKSVSSKIWTSVAVSISYDDNHYTTGTSITPRAPPMFYYIINILLISKIVSNSF